MGFSVYPYTNYSDLNLDWILKKLNEVSDKLSEYLENAVITFGDPIQWDITSQYTTNTMVIDKDGTAYLSKQPVPAGVDITNTDYWQPIFNYDDNIKKLERSLTEKITDVDESLTNDIDNVRDNIATNLGDSPSVSSALSARSLAWYNGNLYVITSNIPAGGTLIPGTNAEQTTLENYLRSSEYVIKVNNIGALRTTDIAVNNLVLTGYYYNPGDKGGGTLYYIRAHEDSDVDNNGNIILLNNGNTAVMVPGDSVSFYQFGARGDGVTNDNTSVINAVRYASNNNCVLTGYNGSFLINSNIVLQDIILRDFGEIKSTSDNTITANINCQIENGSFNGVRLNVGGYYNNLINVSINNISGGTALTVFNNSNITGPYSTHRNMGVGIYENILISSPETYCETGIQINCPDMRFFNCTVCNARKGFRISAAAATLLKCWSWRNGNCPFNGSVAFETTTTGVVMNDCVSDTMELALSVPSEYIYVDLGNFTIMNNPNLQKNSTLKFCNHYGFIYGNVFVNLNGWKQNGNSLSIGSAGNTMFTPINDSTGKTGPWTRGGFTPTTDGVTMSKNSLIRRGAYLDMLCQVTFNGQLKGSDSFSMTFTDIIDYQYFVIDGLSVPIAVRDTSNNYITTMYYMKARNGTVTFTPLSPNPNVTLALLTLMGSYPLVYGGL